MKLYSNSASTMECSDAQTKLVAETRVLFVGPPPRPDSCDLRTYPKTRLFGRRTARTDCGDRVLLCTVTRLLNRSFGGLILHTDDSVSSLSEYLTFRSLFSRFPFTSKVWFGFGTRSFDLSLKSTASSRSKVDLWIPLPCTMRGERTSIHCLSKYIFEKFVPFNGTMNMEQVRRPCVQKWSLRASEGVSVGKIINTCGLCGLWSSPLWLWGFILVVSGSPFVVSRA
jgi:hypothetical protein